MPKKTKKQKILAETRSASSYQPHVFTYSASPIKQKSQTASLLENNSLLNIRKDLIKTVIIGVIFIIVEFVLAKFIGK